MQLGLSDAANNRIKVVKVYIIVNTFASDDVNDEFDFHG